MINESVLEEGCGSARHPFEGFLVVASSSALLLAIGWALIVVLFIFGKSCSFSSNICNM